MITLIFLCHPRPGEVRFVRPLRPRCGSGIPAFTGRRFHDGSRGDLGGYLLKNFQQVFHPFSVAGINERGCYNSNLLLVETERAMMTSATPIAASRTGAAVVSIVSNCPGL